MSSPLRHNFDHTRRKRDEQRERERHLKRIDNNHNSKLEQRRNVIQKRRINHHHHRFSSSCLRLRKDFGSCDDDYDYDHDCSALTQLPSEIIIHDPPKAHDQHHHHKEIAHVKGEGCCATDNDDDDCREQGSEESESEDDGFQPQIMMSSTNLQGIKIGIMGTCKSEEEEGGPLNETEIRLTTPDSRSPKELSRKVSPSSSYDESLSNPNSLNYCYERVLRRTECDNGGGGVKSWKGDMKLNFTADVVNNVTRGSSRMMNGVGKPGKFNGDEGEEEEEGDKCKNVIISSASLKRKTNGGNGVMGRILNFIFCSAFLIHSINYCKPVVVTAVVSNSNNYYPNNHLISRNYLGDGDMDGVKDFVSSSSSSKSWSFLRRQNNNLVNSEATTMKNAKVNRNFEMVLDKQNRSSSTSSSGSSSSSLPSTMKSASRENKRTGSDDDDEMNSSKMPRSTSLGIAAAEEKLKQMLAKPLDQLDKDVLREALWEAMTPEEVRRIFGHKEKPVSASSESVPNFDITKPEIIHDLLTPPLKSRRRRRRNASFNYDDETDTENKLYPGEDDPKAQKLIKLEGLGRRFTMRIYPNQKLLDPYFVHLHRHENRSEILSHDIVRKQLNCFYHGDVEHRSKSKEVGQGEEGAVALSLCGGMKGFILPSTSVTSGGSGEQYHYVIHPLPERITKSMGRGSVDQSESASSHYNYGDNGSSSTGAGGNGGHHIILKRTGSFYPAEVAKLLKSEQKSSGLVHDGSKAKKRKLQLNLDKGRDDEDDENDNDEVHYCMHHDTRVEDGIRFRAEHKNLEIEIPNSDELKLDPNRKMPITPALNYEEDDVNDPKLDKASLTPQKDSSAEHFRARRMKRGTPNFNTDTIDPFTFKSISERGRNHDDFGGTNWPRFSEYRGRGTTTARERHHHQPHQHQFFSGGAAGYDDHDQQQSQDETRISSQFTYGDGFKVPSRFTSTIDSNGRVMANQNIFWHTNSRHSQTAPDVLESGRSRGLRGRSGRGRYEDGIGVTGTGQASPEDSSVAGSDHMTWNRGILVFESSAIHENNFDKNVPFVTKKNSRKESTSVVSSTSSHRSSSSSSSPSFDWFSGRSGVGSYDGGKSYSALKDPFTSVSSRKGRRDDGTFGNKWKSSLDSDLTWTERSNEIGRQNKVGDLSQVKDRPHSHLTIETAVFIDKDLYKHMQQNFPEDTQGEVTAIVLAMINAVQLLYQDPSLGHRVDFVLKRLEVLETDPPTLIRPYDIDRFLTNFCKWQKTENPASDADPLHWDHALILTGLDLYVVHQSGKISNQVVGLAPVAGMCTRSSSCTVNEGKHFESVFVVAHELGHNLGMRHDGPQAENNCDPTSHIMSPTLGSGKITWSPCSKKYLDMFLETTQAKCLFDAAKAEKWLDHNEDGRLPGERFDADRQCVLKYGRGSFHANQQPLEDVCRDLHCRREFFTWTSHPALDGTTCSATGDMWCRSGKCVQKTNDWSYPLKPHERDHTLSNSSNKYTGFYGSTNHLPGSETAAYATQKALDGGWGKWSPFTDCSSACIYSDEGKLTKGSTGVRLAARRCDSPRPENGGRQCNGPDRRYKTCSATSICAKSLARTTLFQYANEVCTRAAQVDAELTGRGYMSSSNEPEKACSVWCETNDKSGPRSRGWSFPDGTVCTLKGTLKNSQTYCVAGKCQEFTCNPYSIFRLSDDDCISINSNEIIQLNPSFERSRDSTGEGSWQNSDSRNSGSRISTRSNEVGWSEWEGQSECKLACLAPAKGLELVKRQCILGDTVCTGLSLSVRLCKPDKSSVSKNGCVRSQTPFEYATKVCTKYAKKVSGLSGIGMQLSPTKSDSDRPCRIGCQDSKIPYRFYMVNGDEGWFPAGTDCSRGERQKKSYCIAGKCVAFGDDDTPLYHTNTSFKESYLQLPRRKRQTVYNIMEPLKMDPTIDESSLKELVYKFSHETGNYPSISLQTSNTGRRRSDTVINRDANRGYSSRQLFGSVGGGARQPYTTDALLRGRSETHESYHAFKRQSIGNNNNNALVNNSIPDEQIIKYKPIEGSYYEWRKILSDCSVVCGNGIQEVIVQCVSGNTVVSDALCQQRQRPGVSGYQSCFSRSCAQNPNYPDHQQAQNGNTGGTPLWNWIQTVLAKKNNTNNAQNN